MHTLTDPDTVTSNTDTSASTVSLHHLGIILDSMWAHEPDSRFGERHHRLNTLRRLMVDVERLAFRQSFHRDEPVDEAAVAACVDRAAHLADQWSDDLWVATPWPTDVLGPRTRQFAA